LTACPTFLRNLSANLIAINGNLYGTTNFGCLYGYGTVFLLKPKG
jgi:uncharacterized repeat protein (TIGR03803 family)